VKSNSISSNAAIALAAFVLFTLSYKLNEYFDAFMLFAAGVSLVYIPAGVKLLCLLVGGGPALIGLLASSLYLNLVLWANLSLLSSVYFALIGVGSYAVVVYLIRRQFQIRLDLSNLNYLHIIVLCVAASFANGFGQNLVYLTQGVTAPDELISKSTAMAFGDFLGCFLVVMLFHAGITATRAVAARRSGDAAKGR
jgi:hypothetical protein